MPYSPTRRDATRETIVRAARRLFNRFGFDGVSVGRIMAESGLTHGGFYRHFRSKSDLYAEALQCFFTDPTWSSHWEGIEIDRTAADIGPQIVRAYLSRQHFEDVENSCPTVALPGDVARSGDSAKRAYEAAFQGHGRHPAAGLAPHALRRSGGASGGAIGRRVVRRRHGHRPRERGSRSRG
jgi:AcrR family transcriptional regulator